MHPLGRSGAGPGSGRRGEGSELLSCSVGSFCNYQERNVAAAAVAMAPKGPPGASGRDRAGSRWSRFACREGEAPDAQSDALLVLEIPSAK